MIGPGQVGTLPEPIRNGPAGWFHDKQIPSGHREAWRGAGFTVAPEVVHSPIRIAGGGARTHTILRSLDFESSASASSATPAAGMEASERGLRLKPFSPR